MRDKILTLLVDDVQNKIGRKINYSKDCSYLSEQIRKETKRYVSPSTFKRFFGLVNSPFKPSRYTLDTLTVFLGYEDFHEYLNRFDTSPISGTSMQAWAFLKSRIKLITDHSLASLKLKTGYNSGRFIYRSFMHDKMSAFAESSATATMLVAPDGHGKSTLLIQTVEALLADSDRQKSEDIICLIDGGIFFNLFAVGPGFDFLHQLLEFKMNSSLSYFFQENPDQVKGQFWLFIDDIGEVYSQKKSYHQLVENLMKIILLHENSNWFKVVFTCRPENMETIAWFVKKNPYLKNRFFQVDFPDNDMSEAINVPLLDDEEIEQILKTIGFKHTFDYLKTHDGEIVEILRYPFLLDLFHKNYKPARQLSGFMLLSQFVNDLFYKEPYRDEKLSVVNRFFELCDLARETRSVKKDELLKGDFEIGYDELVAHGLIYEYASTDNTLAQTVYIRFCQSPVFEYLLLSRWIKDKPLTAKLIFEIKSFYSHNEQLQCKLFQWATDKLLFHKDYDTIVELMEKFESTLAITDTAIAEFPPDLLCVGRVIKKWVYHDEELGQMLLKRLSNSYLKELLTPVPSPGLDGFAVSSRKKRAI